MSGSLMQRGIPGLYDPYTRAEAAVRCGMNLVVTLPFPWSCAGAEHFAMGGAAVAGGLLAEGLCFGSESGDLSLLEKAAEIRGSEAYSAAVKKADREERGTGTAVLYDDVMTALGFPVPLGANDKLGTEYLIWGKRFGISRFHAHLRLADTAHASDLRAIIRKTGLEDPGCRESIPEEALSVFCRSEACGEERFSFLLFSHCRLMSEEEPNPILRYASRIARESERETEFLEKLPTKKYPLARLRREILFSLLGVGDAYQEPPAFTVLLGADERGRRFLREGGKMFTLPIITKPADTEGLSDVAVKQYRLHRAADECYALCRGWRADELIRRHPFLL
jgi:predicted nucleotidyltransferase